MHISTRLARLIHTEVERRPDSFRVLSSMYLNVATGEESYQDCYTGEQSEELDANITLAVVKHALHKLRMQSAPRADGINNKLLKNLAECELQSLTELFNQEWSSGDVPADWKLSNICLISKKGKQLALSKLRPISLTSCVRKLLEHVILRRMQHHADAVNIFSNEMIGFREHLSTQELILRLQADCFTPATGVRAILALDLRQAFDRVKYEAILDGLRSHNFGTRTYRYILNFLRDRGAFLQR